MTNKEKKTLKELHLNEANLTRLLQTELMCTLIARKETMNFFNMDEEYYTLLIKTTDAMRELRSYIFESLGWDD